MPLFLQLGLVLVQEIIASGNEDSGGASLGKGDKDPKGRKWVGSVGVREME